MYTMILDVETSGLPEVKKFNEFYDPKLLKYYERSRLIEIGYSIYDKNNVKISDTSNLILPNNFTINNSHVHGITHQHAMKDGINIMEAFKIFDMQLDTVDVIVGHNIMFDIAIISSECHRYGLANLIEKITKNTIVCTMKLGKEYIGCEQYPSLCVLYRTLFKKYTMQKHRALEDVSMCAQCYFFMSDT